MECAFVRLDRQLRADSDLLDADVTGGGSQRTKNRDRFLTRRWNNVLTFALGLPTLLFALVALTADAVSDRAAFFGVVALSAFF